MSDTGHGPTRRSRRTLLVGIGLAAVVLAAVLVGWALTSGGAKPKLTYQGRSITDPGNVLRAAEATVAADVRSRHGARSADSRCYFTQARTVRSGQRRSDVGDRLLCGPVLFVDGDEHRPYVAVPLHATLTADRATLTPASSLGRAGNLAAPGTVTLIRPDGQDPPAGSGGLSVPQPPPADSTVLTTAALGSSSPPPPLDGATMVGRNERVTLVSAGVVPRYGSGDDARSTPDGGQLIAFRITTGDGDIGHPPASGGLTVAVTGGPARKVPQPSAGEYVVLAVPASASAALVLDDGGLAQSLTLPGGVAGAANIAVLTRQHRFVQLATTVDVPARLSNGTDSADVTYRTRLNGAALDFWLPRHPASRPSNTSSAMLSVDLSYTDPNAPGDTFGWDPQLLRLKLPDGTVVPARNVATSGSIFDVFQVPAGFTRATLLITGSETVRGITLKVARPASMTITIPAG